MDEECLFTLFTALCNAIQELNINLSLPNNYLRNLPLYYQINHFLN